MIRSGKRARHIRELASAKRQKEEPMAAVATTTTATTTYFSFNNIYEAHWEGPFESEEESEIEISEPEDNISEEA